MKSIHTVNFGFASTMVRASAAALDPRRWTSWLAPLLALGVAGGLWALFAGGSDGLGTAELRFEWRAGDGFRGEVSFHEALPDQPLSETLTYREGEEPRIGPELAGGIIRPEMGTVKRFLVVVHNPTGEPLRFWVTPHLPLPYSAEPGLILHCLCTGQQYEIPPHGVWTKVIETGLNPEAGTHGPVVLTHAFIAGDVPAVE